MPTEDVIAAIPPGNSAAEQDRPIAELKSEVMLGVPETKGPFNTLSLCPPTFLIHVENFKIQSWVATFWHSIWSRIPEDITCEDIELCPAEIIGQWLLVARTSFPHRLIDWFAYYNRLRGLACRSEIWLVFSYLDFVLGDSSNGDARCKLLSSCSRFLGVLY